MTHCGDSLIQLFYPCKHTHKIFSINIYGSSKKVNQENAQNLSFESVRFNSICCTIKSNVSLKRYENGF